MLSSEDSNKFSSKRVITFMSFMFVSLAFLADTIFDIKVDKNMFDGMIQIVWAGLGVTVGEHLLKKKHDNTRVETTTTVEINPNDGCEVNDEEGEESEYGDF